MEIIEEWKDIPDYQGVYQASNLGRIKALERKIIRKYRDGFIDCFIKKEQIIKPVKTPRGYHHVTLANKNGSKQEKIHRIVAFAFIGKSKMEINHKNGIKTDNRIENLEYCTRSYNISHSFKTGLRFPRDIGGEKNPMNKIKKEQKIEILSMLKAGINQKEIANKFSISQSRVSQINTENFTRS